MFFFCPFSCISPLYLSHPKPPISQQVPLACWWLSGVFPQLLLLLLHDNHHFWFVFLGFSCKSRCVRIVYIYPSFFPGHDQTPCLPSRKPKCYSLCHKVTFIFTLQLRGFQLSCSFVSTNTHQQAKLVWFAEAYVNYGTYSYPSALSGILEKM